MKRFMIAVMLVALTLMISGCYHSRVVVSPDYDPATAQPDVDESRWHILGLIPIGGDINLEERCPAGAGVVESRWLFPIFVVNWSNIKVYCNTGRTDADVDMSPELASSDL